MKKALILFLCTVLFLAAGGTFLWVALADDIVHLVPSVLMLLCAFLFTYLLIKKLFIGYNEYWTDGICLTISRREKIIATVSPRDIVGLVVFFDAVSKDEWAISFRYGKHRFYVSLTSENRENIKAFIEGIPYKKRGNVWYYVLSLIGN